MLPYQNLSLEDMDGEVWKDIPGWEGYYQVSNMGRAKSLGRWVLTKGGKMRNIKTRILKQPLLPGRRYLSFVVSMDNSQTRIYVHRIVCMLFNPNPDGKPCVDHINTNTLDNRAENLRWVTHQENSSNPLTKLHTSKAKSGRSCFFYGKVFGSKQIVCQFPDGSETIFPSIMDASRAGFTYRAIQYCLSGEYRTHKGCRFHYAD